ncbi:polyketide synthase [Grosmannia clavigera kw1407]|uniref:Polyketide synthase n=1 Tax=Grosmannia clavigera (strain kw1407 / UAMH 11150) TaxID=655863 RepID=F0XS40_GROCL|nr:polyketide synthase [Grosmannia clavigera kw1407]EFW99415.1 polyketide synthase [Grosmannia clavigera kw1407]
MVLESTLTSDMPFSTAARQRTPKMSNGDGSNGVEAEPAGGSMPIALIGMSCRFPGDATNPEKFWKLCAEGRSAWSKIPADRFDVNAFYNPSGEQRTTTKVIGGHFLSEDIGLFDATFFNMTPEVAACRLQLESVFEAFESCGVTLEKIAGSPTGVYAATFVNDYVDSLMRDPDTFPRFLLAGNGATMMANRISHFYDLRGPSLTLDTGCSSALVALNQACQSLMLGDAKMAVVAAANLAINPDIFILMTSLGVLSAEGKSYAFDDRASGYGRGEGIGTLILKPLKDALRDGDPIRAIVRQTFLNQDGKTPTITSPSQLAQEELIRDCYARAALDPLETPYAEAHGTGTQVGDSTEAAALQATLGSGRPRGQPLRFGSVKTNIGHLEATSGIAAIIKAAMAMEKGFVPPSINFETGSKNIPFDKWDIKVQQQLEPWPQIAPRRASINNFGYGGSNAHVILEGWSGGVNGASKRPESSTNGDAVGRTDSGTVVKHGHGLLPRVFVLSAKDESVGRAMATRLGAYVAESALEDDELLGRLAYTLSERQSRFPWTVATSAASREELVSKLSSSAPPPQRSAMAPRLGFVFTGQGAQWYGMGRELIGVYPVFTDTLREADGYLCEMGSPWSLMDELKKDETKSRVGEGAIGPPLCIALQVALFRQLGAWGIKPTAMTSHSSGEIAAACAAGVLSLREVMAMVYARGQLLDELNQQSARQGGMMAVGLGAEEAQQRASRLKRGSVAVACLNSPSSVTMAGDQEAMEELREQLEAEGVFARRLNMTVAFHSHHMDTVGPAYLKALRQTLGQPGSFGDLVYASPVTGSRLADATVMGPEYWVRSIVQPVLFVDALRAVCVDEVSGGPIDMLVEIGPHRALAGPIRQCLRLPEFGGTDIAYGSCLVRGEDAVRTMQVLVSSLVAKGYAVDLDAVNCPGGHAGPMAMLVDLPAYPWAHTTRYWWESRINKAHRQRREPCHDLLGARVLSGGNPSNTTWRHFFRVADQPWTREHVVQAENVYPGAGMMCMVVQAMQQMSSASDQQPTGYRFRDVDMPTALIVPETLDGIEAQLCLQAASLAILGLQTWRRFSLHSTDGDGGWTYHCSGLVAAVVETSPDSPSPCACATGFFVDTNPGDLFRYFRSVSIVHGPTFRNLCTLGHAPGQAVTDIVLADETDVMPGHYQQDHVMHPTTLDSVFVTAYASLPGCGARMQTAMLPRTIKSMFVSTAVSAVPGDRLHAHAVLHEHSDQGFCASIEVRSGTGHDGPIVVQVEEITCQSLGEYRTQDSQDDNICFAVRWEEDLALTSLSDLARRLTTSRSRSEVNSCSRVQRACRYFVQDALSFLSSRDIPALPVHLRRYYAWMKEQTTGTASPTQEHDDKESLFQAVSAESVEGEMICRIGRNLLRILRQEVTAEELLQQDQLMHRYDGDSLRMRRSHQHVAHLVTLLTHKNPHVRILELGVGTGACAEAVLSVLSSSSESTGPRFMSYDVSDTSSDRFDEARQNLEAWDGLLTYRTLNTEFDPGEQGFELASYDIIIARQALDVLAPVRSLLRDGGMLIQVERTRDAIDLHLVHGLLHEYNQHSPVLATDIRNAALRNAGFSDLCIQISDCQDEGSEAFTVGMATAVSPVTNTNTNTNTNASGSGILLTHSQPIPPAWPRTWLRRLQDGLRDAQQGEVTVEGLETAQPANRLCIFVDDAENPVLMQPTEPAFARMQHLCTTASGVLWIAQGGAAGCENPFAALHLGFLRTLRSEHAHIRYVSVDLDAGPDAWSVAAADALLAILTTALDPSRDRASLDCEYAVRGRSVLIPRLYESVTETEAIRHQSADTTEPLSFAQPSRPLRLGVGAPGMLDSLRFEDDPDVHTDDLAGGLVEIDPQAFGLNFRDVMVAMGQLDSRLMGFECSGIITRLGPDVPDSLSVGDRVCALLRGHWATRTSVHWSSVARVPDDMSLAVAASVPVTFVTAYYALHVLARIQPGDTVLIHAAAGGTGQAALMLAKHVGAVIYATAGTPEKRDFLVGRYGIPADNVFSSRDKSFAAGIQQATAGQGVDIVLNSLAGDLLHETWSCIGQFGRFVEIGRRDMELNRSLQMHPFTRAVTFSAVDLIKLGELRPDTVHAALSAVMQLFRQGAIQPVAPITTYPLADLERAFRTMQAGRHLGKIVVVPHQNDIVPVKIRTFHLSPAASYLVVGGMGGIGRSVTQRLVERGAQHIILLSRQAASRQNAPFLEAMRASGIDIVAFDTDIADGPSLAETIQTAKAIMPPIRGVIQSAMVLRDSIFENMTWQDWIAAVRPKVQGTWNLHRQFAQPDDLDFFITLSSACGVVGNAGQANYAAGGTFQDALARYRHARGLAAVSLDLGPVASVGYVADNEAVTNSLKRQGFRTVEQEEIVVGLSVGGDISREDAPLAIDVRFASLRRISTAASPNRKGDAASSLASALPQAKSWNDAVQAVCAAIVEKLTRMLTLSEADIDVRMSVSHYGVDSLVAVELRNWISASLHSEISVFDIMQARSITGLAQSTCAKSKLVSDNLKPA